MYTLFTFHNIIIKWKYSTKILMFSWLNLGKFLNFDLSLSFISKKTKIWTVIQYLLSQILSLLLLSKSMCFHYFCVEYSES